ncbi:MAG: DUF3995 domain-containing protein [Saprospiraceae bacterium]
MMIPVLSIILATIFGLLGFIHFYWSFGKTWGLDITIPTTLSGDRVLRPKKLDCALVGLGLSLCSLFYLKLSGLIDFEISSTSIKVVSWIIPVIFILRAIGDFKYVGYFKKIKNTSFGIADSKIFTPLCLIIGAIGIIIQIL